MNEIERKKRTNLSDELARMRVDLDIARRNLDVAIRNGEQAERDARSLNDNLVAVGIEHEKVCRERDGLVELLRLAAAEIARLTDCGWSEEIDRLRAEVEALRAELLTVTAERDAARARLDRIHSFLAGHGIC